MTNRRDVLQGTLLALLGEQVAKATVITGKLPWRPGAGSPPQPVEPGGWRFFTSSEAAAVEALAERIIPADPQTLGGKDAGCAVFIDRQLAGPYGHQAGLYTSPPFNKGVEQQGPQSADGPAMQYRKALAALDQHCVSTEGGKTFAQLSPEKQDRMLSDLESGALQFAEIDGKAFFKSLVKDMQTGFFADPIYGGNKDMCGWKMIGFPGAHYDYRDWVGRHNQRYPHPPVSISGRPEWTPKNA
jgi:gluconate 2-dehydrogenase gamma chain